MKDETNIILDDVVERLQDALRARNQPAITIVEADYELVLTEPAYLRHSERADAYEQHVAAEARQATADRLALAVPQILTTLDDDTVRLRSPLTGIPDEETEREVILWMTYDIDDKVTYGAMPFTRRAGAPGFDPDMPSVFLPPTAGIPGTTLPRHLLDENLRPRRP